jgi:GntP family gluconate:H+ symporter
MLAVAAYKADVGRTIAYGFLVGLPTASLAGPVFASWIAPRIALPVDSPIAAQFAGGVPRDIPGFPIALFTVLLPVILMVCASTADVALDTASTLRTALDFVGSPIVALLLALLFSFWSLGYKQRLTRDQILKFANDCLGPTATILLVIGAGGGFNKVLLESGVGKAIVDLALGSHASPLLLAWRAVGARDRRGLAHALTRERRGVLAHQGVLQHDRPTDAEDVDRSGDDHRRGGLVFHDVAQPRGVDDSMSDATYNGRTHASCRT